MKFQSCGLESEHVTLKFKLCRDTRYRACKGKLRKGSAQKSHDMDIEQMTLCFELYFYKYPCLAVCYEFLDSRRRRR